MILVSHDRDFLQNLTNKVYEFKNQNIKEYLGDIDFYLDQRKVENFREIEKKEKNYFKEKNKVFRKIDLFKKKLTILKVKFQTLKKKYLQLMINF